MNPSIVISLFGLIIFAVSTISAYYTGTPRIEEIFPKVSPPGSSGIVAYFLGILIPLVAYLYFKLMGKTRQVSWLTVGGYFLWVLLMTSWFTFAHVGDNSGVGSQSLTSGIQLFFHVLKYLLFLAALAIAFSGSGNWILKKAQLFDTVSPSVRIPLSIGIGWSVFTLMLASIGFFGMYNIWVFYGLLFATLALSYGEILELLKELPGRSFRIANDATGGIPVKPRRKNGPMHQVSEVLEITVDEGNDAGNDYGMIRLIINCILLVTLFVVLTTNLVNIVRPYPIGWDDLGAYMNIPKLFALFKIITSVLSKV